MPGDEVVVCIPAMNVSEYNPQDIVSTALHTHLPRSVCETDENYRQLIPYCAVMWEGKILAYDRKGAEQRLHGLSSIGVGGHIAAGETVVDGMRRELLEEAGLSDWTRKYLGNIILSETPVDRVHLGLAYLVEARNKPEPQAELRNARWLSIDECRWLVLEPWSVELLKRIKERV